MKPLFRNWEIILYAFVSFVPYMAVAIKIFHENLRFSKRVTGAVALMLCVVHALSGYCASVWFPNREELITVIGYVIYLATFMIMVKTPAGKLAFAMFFIFNYASLLTTLAKCTEYMLFPQMALQTYRWTFSLMTVILQAMTLPPILLFIEKRIQPAILQKETDALWKYLWCVPFTFYLVYYYATYQSPLSALELAIRPQNAIFLGLINLGFLLTYDIVARMVYESLACIRLEKKNYELKMQTLQWNHLQQRMEEARRARHDIRQHDAVLYQYYQNGEFDKLGDYLEKYHTAGHAEGKLVYCAHSAVNAVALYYFDMAEEAHIEVDAKLNLPQQIDIADSDLTVLFGNLFENALEACIRQNNDEKRLIRATANITGDMLILTTDNTCAKKPTIEHGTYLSTKREGQSKGYGLESIQAIAQKYHGQAHFIYEDQMFRASVMLMLP